MTQFRQSTEINRRSLLVTTATVVAAGSLPRRAVAAPVPVSPMMATLSSYMAEAGFDAVSHYYRPPGLPREQQPWLASVWRKISD